MVNSQNKLSYYHVYCEGFMVPNGMRLSLPNAISFTFTSGQHARVFYTPLHPTFI